MLKNGEVGAVGESAVIGDGVRNGLGKTARESVGNMMWELKF